MKLKICFFNIALSLFLFCVAFLTISSRAYAYEKEDNFYPLIYNNSYFRAYINDSETYQDYQSIVKDNRYHYSNPDLDNVFSLLWCQKDNGAGSDDSFVFPYHPDLYDYYFLGTLTSYNTDISQSTFKPTLLEVSGYDYASNKDEYYILENVEFYDLDTVMYSGFGWYSKIDFLGRDNAAIQHVNFLNDKDGLGNKPANLVLDMGILAIEKGQSETAVMSQILNQLQYMENSINSSIGSAADQVTGSIVSASNSITSKIQESFDSLTSNLTDWFDDVFNGYGGSGTDQASDNFDTSAGELHTTETQITDITNSSVTNYTDFAFNTNVLTTLGASLVYVVTWFTNFWDVGGLYTAVLNIGLALFVAFFILRLRGDP